MAKGYWIAKIDVRDMDGYKPYMAASTAAVQKFGGRFLVRGGQMSKMEGESRTRCAVIEFDSYEQALACYNSEDYKAARAIRQAHSDADLIVVEGAA